MRLLLFVVFSFISFVAFSQAPPMNIGGSQGINVKRILAQDWMSVPIMADTPVAPLTGSGWPGKGYLVFVAQNPDSVCVGCPPADTSLWEYTGQRWKRVGMDYLTKLVYGGDVGRQTNRRYFVTPYAAFINGNYYTTTNNTNVTTATKTADSTSRIDVIVITTSGPTVKVGIPNKIPFKPPVAGDEIELSTIYFPPFDTTAKFIPSTAVGVTNIFRVAGRDSIYFSIDTVTLAIKDSIGISKNDTATMLNNYKFTAANGLAKDSTVFRLGGSLNQNTNINLNSRRLNIIGGSDTTRFFSNGRVSIGGTPDSSQNLRVNGNTRITGNTFYNGNLLPTFGSIGQVSLGLTSSVGTSAKLQAYWNNGNSTIQSLDFTYFGTTLNSEQYFDSSDFVYDLWKFKTTGQILSNNGGGTSITDFAINPTFRVGPRSNDTSTYYGVRFVPILDSANKVNMIPFSNTIGSNMFNTASGNTRIGYPYAFQTPIQFDTTYKLDVNGTGRFRGDVRIDNLGYLRIPTNNKIQLGSSGYSYGFNTFIGNVAPNVEGDRNTYIGYADGHNNTNGSSNTIIGAINNRNNVTGSDNVIIGSGMRNYLSNPVTQNGTVMIGSTYYMPDTTIFTNVLGIGFNFNRFSNGGTYSNIMDFYGGGGRPENNSLNFGSSDLGGIQLDNVYFNGNTTGGGWNGRNITINGSGGATSGGNNKSGGGITIAGGKGTGNGTPGFVAFSTSTALSNPSDSTTLQILTERARISPSGNLLVGTTTDVPSSKFTVTSTTQGFLPPRMTGAQAELISSPAEGLMIYSTDGSGTTITSKGWWGYNGSTWVKLN